MQPENNNHDKIESLILENQKLIAENTKVLKKLQRTSAVTMWLRIVGFLFMIGLPFVLYFYVVQPYFDALGSSFGTFQAGLQEIPGWKQFYEALGGADTNVGE